MLLLKLHLPLDGLAVEERAVVTLEVLEVVRTFFLIEEYARMLCGEDPALDEEIALRAVSDDRL